MTDPRGYRKRINVEVNQETYEVFESMYPQNGAFTWFVNACLERFVQYHEIQPDEHVAAAVRAALDLDMDEIGL